jgi:hypothetical protein
VFFGHSWNSRNVVFEIKTCVNATTRHPSAHARVSASQRQAIYSTFADLRITEGAMANKEQRSNREKRKPKKEKPKSAPQVSSFSGATTKSAAGQKK